MFLHFKWNKSWYLGNKMFENRFELIHKRMDIQINCGNLINKSEHKCLSVSRQELTIIQFQFSIPPAWVCFLYITIRPWIRECARITHCWGTLPWLSSLRIKLKDVHEAEKTSPFGIQWQLQLLATAFTLSWSSNYESSLTLEVSFTFSNLSNSERSTTFEYANTLFKYFL